ncbi:MAG: creatininase family protein [Rhodospirillales bacterium]|nr:creatininase family protein [Rhodospirillales bacterium]
MMELSPQRVRPERVNAAYPDFDSQYLQLELAGATVAWLTRDYSPTGTWGDATVANPERGRARMDALMEGLVAVLTEISSFEMGWKA